MNIVTERVALRYMRARALAGRTPRVAAARVRIKRRLRRAGLTFDPMLTTAELCLLVLMA